MRGPWINGLSQRLTVKLGRETQSGEKLDLSMLVAYAGLWIPAVVLAAAFEHYLSPSSQYYRAWLFTYGPALPGLYLLQREYRPDASQFGMTVKRLRSRQVWFWSSAAVLVAASWFGTLHWIASAPDRALHPVLHTPTGRSGGLNLLSCSHPVFATLFGVLIGPVVEELVFRGYLYLVLRQNRGRRFAALVSSGIFGALHGANAPVVFAQGLLYIFFDNLGGSLCPSMIGHAAWNGLLLLTCGRAL